MKTEKLLVELCKFGHLQTDLIRETLNGGINEDKLLGLALMHRVGGLVYISILQLGFQKLFSREFMNTLYKVYTYDVLRSRNYTTCVSKLINLFKPEDIRYALLKGAYLVNVYPPGARTANDIDILICESDISSVSRVLSENGYEQGYLNNGVFDKASRRQIVMSRLNRGETVPFVKKIDLPAMEYLEIDLNYSLDYLPRDEHGQVGKMLSKIYDSSNPFLAFEDFVIHLCCHLYKEAGVYEWVRMKRDQKLYKYCDLYMLLCEEKNDMRWRLLAERIKELSLYKECYYALRNTKELFSVGNIHLDSLLEMLRPWGKEADIIIAPQENRRFKYNVPILDWVFSNDKTKYLSEVK